MIFSAKVHEVYGLVFNAFSVLSLSGFGGRGDSIHKVSSEAPGVLVLLGETG